MRPYRAGETIEDACRACKLDRHHTIIVVDTAGQPLRVQCDYCGSQHNFRGGGTQRRNPPGRPDPASRPPHRAPEPALRAPAPAGPPARVAQPAASLLPSPPIQPDAPVLPAPLPPAATTASATTALCADGGPNEMSPHDTVALDTLLRQIIREEAGLTPAAPAEKWRGGTLVLRPANPALQEKAWPIDTFFHKIVMVRNRLRTLEQQVNSMDWPEDVKVRMQGYITGCYGSLTSFNLLFADTEDQFRGSGSGEA